MLPGLRAAVDDAKAKAAATRRRKAASWEPAATDPVASGGQYYGPDRLLETRGHPIVVRSSTRSQNRALQAQLWSLSEDLTGVTHPIA